MAQLPGDQAQDYVDLGFTQHTLTTPAGRMLFHEKGPGTPIVFLHGIGGGASSWTWIFVAPVFAKTHRVIVPDWVGWGGSEHPKNSVLFNDYVTSLEVLLDSLGTSAIIVAQSLASGFAMALAERRPELIKQLVLHTPSGGKDFGLDSFGPVARTTITPFARLPVIGPAFYRMVFHRRAFIAGWLRQQGFADRKDVTRKIVDAFLFNARRPNSAASALPFAAGKLRYDIAPLLKKVALPTSIFWGDEENQVGQKVALRLAALRPDIPFVFLKNSKACPELEHPAAVISNIRRAL